MTKPTNFFVDAYGQATKNGVSIAPDGSLSFITVDINGQQNTTSPGSSVSQVSAVTYDGQNRVTGYVNNGRSYTVSYPSSTLITVVGNGVTRNITLDGSGRIISSVTV